MIYTFNFKVRNKQATRTKHASRIDKVKKAIKYKDIIDNNFEPEVESYVFNQPWFQHSIIKREPSQSKAKEIATLVNYQARVWICNNLEYMGYPKSWGTAFYMLHYKKINRAMKRIAKSLFNR